VSPWSLPEEVDRCADPPLAATTLGRLFDSRPDARERLDADPALARAVVTVAAASPYLGRVCVTEPAALDVLADLDTRPSPEPHSGAPAGVARWKRLETLRLAARDLQEIDGLEAVGAGLADLADDVLDAAFGLHPGPLAVIGMGKLGARELNYASDIDVMLVAAGTPGGETPDPRPLLSAARQSWRVDLDLRPEGRSGPLVRTLDSYLAYWQRWARTWEFQALLKARPVAGNPDLGDRFVAAAAEQVWDRPFGAEELRQVRDMKARAEGQVARAGMASREIKRGRGGIRDVEFAVQLLQMVHGRVDPRLRAPATLDALEALAAGGYVDRADAGALAEAYRYLRAVEHRLQLWEDQQVHTVPADERARTRLARVLGFRDTAARTAVAAFDERLRRHQATVRAIHEKLFFRPLLEAFTFPTVAGLTESAVETRLAAFGFSDAARTRQAVTELTKGFSRASALMAQLLPVVLEWLSHAPDPDLGLLGWRALASGRHRRDQLTAMCRESAAAARALCVLLGTGPLFVRGFEHHPEALGGLVDGNTVAERSPGDLAERVAKSLSWRAGSQALADGLRQWKAAESLRIAARDVLGLAGVEATAAALTDLATITLAQALETIDPQVPLAVIGMGRLGGRELGYGSDLDILLVYDGERPPAAGAARDAEAAAISLLRLVNGDTPAARIYTIDVGLRPEGRHGPLARSLDAYAAYYERWAQPWERQALLRGRFIAGDRDVGRRFATVASRFVRGRPLTAEDEREIRRIKARVEKERIPAGEDPQFHLKLGRGSLSDVEWTVQLLQLRHGVAATGTMEALGQLTAAGRLEGADSRVLGEAYRFCEATRNRLYLIRGGPGDSLPGAGHQLTVLARSLGTTATDLREEYRRVTRRCRRVVEHLFYAAADRGAP
jgi:glutamate-ammonia-ligase adenylyltransferase